VPAAAVVNELAALFVEASLARRQAHAQRATEFLRQELARDEAGLSAQAHLVTEFRQEHRGTLPNELGTSLQRLAMLAAEKDALNTQIDQRQNHLYQLASSPQTLITTPSQELLDELRRQLASEVAANTEEHPNVVALRHRIANQEETVAAEREQATGDDSELGHLLSAERANTRLLRARVERIEAQILDLNDRIERTPQVAEELTALMQTLVVLREDYVGTMRNVKEAELGESLESAQQGGRVTILHRARPPGSPVEAMWLTLAVGLFGTIALALGSAVLLELVDPVIVSLDQLHRITEHAVLGSLPEIA
jgi:uncharacterized protein involved in exopolysaccharide biosynthesis